MKKNEQFLLPQEKVRRANQRLLKTGCVACLAIACVFTVQNLMPLDFYINPGIDENTKVYYNTPLLNQESNGEAGDMQDGITFDMGGGMQGGGGAPGGGRPSGGGPGGF